MIPKVWWENPKGIWTCPMWDSWELGLTLFQVEIYLETPTWCMKQAHVEIHISFFITYFMHINELICVFNEPKLTIYWKNVASYTMLYEVHWGVKLNLFQRSRGWPLIFRGIKGYGTKHFVFWRGMTFFIFTRIPFQPRFKLSPSFGRLNKLQFYTSLNFIPYLLENEMWGKCI